MTSEQSLRLKLFYARYSIYDMQLCAYIVDTVVSVTEEGCVNLYVCLAEVLSIRYIIFHIVFSATGEGAILCRSFIDTIYHLRYCF